MFQGLYSTSQSKQLEQDTFATGTFKRRLEEPDFGALNEDAYLPRHPTLTEPDESSVQL